ncbi:hypothetical protein [Dyadobacter bucti]|uniref:hypothetical protein n=1 Tax=Dyadobacter bucti TaxID=2572203 RepID=UPI001107DE91|nr:hypothetical protein [Dyadobacter bucti]
MKLLKIAIVLVLSSLCFSVLNKYRKLTLPKSYTEVDSLDIMLADAKMKLPANSTIGFRTNAPVGRQDVLYFKSALVLAPIVVGRGENDTMLLIQDHQFPALPLDQYECIHNGGGKYLNYSLVRIKE